jgi:hypothetical protein
MVAVDSPLSEATLACVGRCTDDGPFGCGSLRRTRPVLEISLGAAGAPFVACVGRAADGMKGLLSRTGIAAEGTKGAAPPNRRPPGSPLSWAPGTSPSGFFLVVSPSGNELAPKEAARAERGAKPSSRGVVSIFENTECDFLRSNQRHKMAASDEEGIAFSDGKVRAGASDSRFSYILKV